MNMNSKPAAGVTLQIPASGNWNPVYGNPSLAAHPVNYTVSAGESVYSIACKFGDVTPEAILAVNGLSSAADLQAGTSIRIP
jgi:LysM repeat protein